MMLTENEQYPSAKQVSDRWIQLIQFCQMMGIENYLQVPGTCEGECPQSGQGAKWGGGKKI